jgi:hypothetical protein
MPFPFPDAVQEFSVETSNSGVLFPMAENLERLKQEGFSVSSLRFQAIMAMKLAPAEAC